MFCAPSKVTCSECKSEVVVLYHFGDSYFDNKGWFQTDVNNAKCSNCGHLINSERIPNAKYAGTYIS